MIWLMPLSDQLYPCVTNHTLFVHLNDASLATQSAKKQCQNTTTKQQQQQSHIAKYFYPVQQLSVNRKAAARTIK